jgi:hypothetical protein
MKTYYYINKKNLKIGEIHNVSGDLRPYNKDLKILKELTRNTQNIHKHPYHLVDPSPWPYVFS